LRASTRTASLSIESCMGVFPRTRSPSRTSAPLGIESMSLNPDTVIKTTRQVLQVENQLVPVR
jgi:hypothetical protein